MQSFLTWPGPYPGGRGGVLVYHLIVNDAWGSRDRWAGFSFASGRDKSPGLQWMGGRRSSGPPPVQVIFFVLQGFFSRLFFSVRAVSAPLVCLRSRIRAFSCSTCTCTVYGVWCGVVVRGSQKRADNTWCSTLPGMWRVRVRGRSCLSARLFVETLAKQCCAHFFLCVFISHAPQGVCI